MSESRSRPFCCRFHENISTFVKKRGYSKFCSQWHRFRLYWNICYCIFWFDQIELPVKQTEPYDTGLWRRFRAISKLKPLMLASTVNPFLRWPACLNGIHTPCMSAIVSQVEKIFDCGSLKWLWVAANRDKLILLHCVDFVFWVQPTTNQNSIWSWQKVHQRT